METYENIKKYRLQLGISQDELAQKTGYKDRSSIAKIESGKVDLPESKILLFAKALNVTPAVLMDIRDTSKEEAPAASNLMPMPAMRSVPLIGTIACGEPILAAENLEGNVTMPEHVVADFALRCRGDSMTGARIKDGDIVYIRQQPEVDNGQIAAVQIGEEATLKRVYRYPDRLVLAPANPAYEPFVYTGSEMEAVRILGKAVAFTSALE